MRPCTILAAVAAALPLSASALSQTAGATDPIIEKRTSGCLLYCTYVTNRNPVGRVVVTLETTPTPSPWPMYDRSGNSVNLGQTVVPVLLQAGETRMLADSIIYEMKSGGERKEVKIDYRVAGFYIPKPDLSDLPTGVAEDFARFYVQWDHDFDGSNACGVGHPEARSLVVRNMNHYRSIAVTFQNGRPGLNNSEQTLYLEPGREQSVGCVFDWPVLKVSGVRFAS